MSRWTIAGPSCPVSQTEWWLSLMDEVDWLFWCGMDTAEIAEHLDMHEAVVSRALSHARAARRLGDRGAA